MLDNAGTNKTARVKRWFERHPEYHLHVTPTSAPWLNQMERFFAEKPIRRAAFRSVAAPEQVIIEYLMAVHNDEPRPFVWTADADLILRRVQKCCARTRNSGHEYPAGPRRVAAGPSRLRPCWSSSNVGAPA